MRYFALLLLLQAWPAPAAEPQPLARLAGEYYEGDGLGVNRRLSIHAEGRFEYAWHGCLGLYDENRGDATLDGDVLRLRPKLPLDEGPGRALGLDWIVVRWDERVYLIEPADMARFAHAVNGGDEPRCEPHGMFLLRDDDWVDPPTGRPALPARWRPYLLESPVEALVTRLLAGKRAEISAGADRGLRAGMLLDVEASWGRVEVQSAESGTAIVRPELGEPVLAPGGRVSSSFGRVTLGCPDVPAP